MRYLALILVGFSFFSVGCTEQSNGPVGVDAVEDAKQEYYLSLNRSVRFQPTEAERVADPHAAGDTINWIWDGFRGDRLTILEEQGDWVKVRMESDARGWLPRSSIVADLNVYQATVVADATTLTAPQAGAVSDRVISAGTLLLVMKETNGYAHVNIEGGEYAWVASSRLSASEQDVGVSKQIIKARWSSARKDVLNNTRLLDKARIKYGTSALLDVLANEVPFSELSEKPILPTLNKD